MRKALVAGALNVTGRAAVNYLTSLGDWEVIGLSRRSPEFQTGAKYIAVDLLDRPALEERLRGITDITHIFFATLS
jgi:nucleoside-diphosphate-sugar epimerase